MLSPNPRKRPAAGASPVTQLPHIQPQYSPPQPDQLLLWNSTTSDSANFQATSTTLDNSSTLSSMVTQGQLAAPVVAAQPSMALARRATSRALVPTGLHPAIPPSTDPWASLSDFLPPSNGVLVGENENIEILEEIALKAKMDAQAKRKQIPPFVQKLSSFLEESKNTDLIRWSEKGDSFIVLDEDEFAKTLIPELFKHNNYASFVRQLNMYGFHKRVGLSDNSMKASERKNKSPSEYYNPYFKRGHPNLLWLISKAKSGGKKKGSGKKDDGDAESEDDLFVDDSLGQAFNHANAQLGRNPAHTEMGTLQKRDLAAVKSQLDHLQQQQQTISALITKLRQDYKQMYEQTLVFQQMHDRHENSINAILNFLANVFRKSLEEQGGAQSISDLLASIIPNSQNQMPQGSVVDLDDFIHPSKSTSTNLTPTKRHQRFLPPIPNMAQNGAAPAPNAVSPTQSRPLYGLMGSVTELFDISPIDSTTTAAYLKQELQKNPQEGIMKIMHDTNAENPSGIDLAGVAAKTNATMSNDRRNKILGAMAAPPSMAQPPVSTTPVARTTSMPVTNVPAAGVPLSNVAPTNIPSPHVSSAVTSAPAVTVAAAAPPALPPSSASAPSVLATSALANPATPTAMPPTLIPPASAPPTNGVSATLPNADVAACSPTFSPNSTLPATDSSNFSLSPLLASAPSQSLPEMSLTQSDIDALQQLQDDQSAKLHELSSLLAPLSPSGRISGLGDHSPNFFTDSVDNVDISDYLDLGNLGDINYGHHNAVAPDAAGCISRNDFPFNIDGVNNPTPQPPGVKAEAAGYDSMRQQAATMLEKAPPIDTPSSASTEEVVREDVETLDPGLAGAKRRRIS